MKKKIVSMMIAVAMCLNFVACGTDIKSQKKGEAGKELEEVTVVLDWYPNAIHSFIYTAIEKGYYEEEGLKVNIQFPTNTNDAISLTAAGKADLGMYYLQDVAIAKGNEGVPIKSVGTIVQSPLSIILSLKEENIKSPSDLENKKLGYGGSALAEAIVETMLEKAGVNKDSTEIVDVGFDLMSSMTTGKVDATIGCLVNHEVPQMEEEGFEVNYFFPNDYGVPDYYELVFITGENTLKENPDKIARFLKASKKGFLATKENSEEALKILLDNQNQENFPLNEAVERKSLDYLLKVMEKEDAEFLSQDFKVWQENINWLKEKGVLKNSFDVKEVVEQIAN